MFWKIIFFIPTILVHSFTKFTTTLNPYKIKTRQTSLIYSHNNTLHESPENKEPDIIEKYSNWLSLFPPEQKWKSVRFTIYSFISGYLLSESIEKFSNYLDTSRLNF
jgi:hypothetical protein